MATLPNSIEVKLAVGSLKAADQSNDTLLARVGDVMKRSEVADADDVVAQLRKRLMPVGMTIQRSSLAHGWEVRINGFLWGIISDREFEEIG